MLKEAYFIPLKTSHALFIPPTGSRFMMRLARLIESIGHFLGLPFGGVVMVLAEKRVHAPINGARAKNYMPSGVKAAIGLHRD